MTRFVRVKRKVFQNVVKGQDQFVFQDNGERYNRGDVLIFMEIKKKIHTGRKWGKRIKTVVELMDGDLNRTGYNCITVEPLNWT